MTDAHKILSVTIDDCEVQTFRAGGKGGQNQNKRDTGVRVIHHPSGARGESREQRSQLQNKQTAFKRMAESLEMRRWIAQKLVDGPSPEEQAEQDMAPHNLKIEVREGGKWTELS